MTMATRRQRIQIERGSGNPYADLGLPDADTMRVKAALASQIAEIVATRHLTQQRAATLVGMTQPKLSDMLRGQFRGISQARMIKCLNRLGRDVNIVVRKASQRSMGSTRVIAR